MLVKLVVSRQKKKTKFFKHEVAVYGVVWYFIVRNTLKGSWLHVIKILLLFKSPSRLLDLDRTDVDDITNKIRIANYEILELSINLEIEKPLEL